MSRTNVIFLFGFILPLFVYGQYSSDCESKETCRDCIQEIDCIWCITPNNQTTPIHCVHKTKTPNDWCPQSDIVSPKSSQVPVQNSDFSNTLQNTIQFKPQRVKISLRKGEKVDINFQYHQAENYPVDLYYIMDLSNSMDVHRKKLGELGVKLAEALKSLTSNVRLGFGSFIDKVELPFVSTVKSKLDRPCSGCVAAYSFKNHLSLSTNYEKFKMEVTNAKVSGNLDSPEGGLDAIMQAIVCKDLIGWRSQARHLLIFSTDAEFHIAGDGKLAGVIEPNDAQCHMIKNDYTEYLKYDYPSVSHINHIANENNVNIMFAIVKKNGSVTESYRKLSERIKNSNFGQLKNDENNNIIDLVTKNYNKIVQSVLLTSNATDDVDVKFSSNCQNPKPNGCDKVHIGETINFVATIQPRECSKDGNKKIISIKPEAVQDRFLIELDILCDCPCSSPKDGTYHANSNKCSGSGDLQCGICKCEPGRFGRNCQCDSSVFFSNETANCKMNEQAEICSGQGECKCGKCECIKRPKATEKVYGKFCQCNNYSCKREGGTLCSGNGECDCGDCKCNAGYVGDACQCRESNSTCIAPGTDSLCSGYGKCVCGQCECNVDGGHSGKFCEECTTCPAQKCEEFRHCVECQAYQTGLYDKNKCDEKCKTFKTEIVKKFSDTEDDTKKCRVPDKNGCIIIFEYMYRENDELIVRAQKDKLCAGPPNILAWILGVIGTILIAGLIMLIIWKVCTTVHDRREYAKFENDRKGLKWHRNDNPLYKEATSTFANPVYNKSVKN